MPATATVFLLISDMLKHSRRLGVSAALSLLLDKNHAVRREAGPRWNRSVAPSVGLNHLFPLPWWTLAARQLRPRIGPGSRTVRMGAARRVLPRQPRSPSGARERKCHTMPKVRQAHLVELALQAAVLPESQGQLEIPGSWLPMTQNAKVQAPSTLCSASLG